MTTFARFGSLSWILFFFFLNVPLQWIRFLNLNLLYWHQCIYVYSYFSALCLQMYIFHNSFFCMFILLFSILTLLKVIKLTFNMYSIIRTNLRILQIVLHYYFHENIKENPNCHGILNWILQILLYHCSKQHKNIKNLVY